MIQLLKIGISMGNNSFSDEKDYNKTSFFNEVFSAWNIIGYSVKILVRYPILLLPLFLCWLLYATEVIYFNYYFNADNIAGPIQFIFIIFLILFSVCFIFSFSALIMLEMIQQIETNNKISFIGAFIEVIKKDLIKAFPIMLIWAILLLVFTILEVLLSKHKKITPKELSYENAARTLGEGEEVSFLNLSFGLITSGVRLIVFFIYPAIAWEDETTINSIKKGFYLIKNNLSKFFTGFFSIELIAIIIFLPVGLLFYFVDKTNMSLPNYVWLITILYIGFACSIYLYLQQVFAALLYMWNIKWLKKVNEIKQEKWAALPKLEDIPMPSILNDEPDLL